MMRMSGPAATTSDWALSTWHDKPEGLISSQSAAILCCTVSGDAECMSVSLTCDLDCEGPQGFLAGDLHQLTKTFSRYLTQLTRGALQSTEPFP